MLRSLFDFRTEKADVSIDACVHYCGFRYAQDEYNPYQTYAIELSHEVSKEKRRERFVEFLKYYRPENMTQALGITLSVPIPLWTYPWDRHMRHEFAQLRGWCKNPKDCPDILTHFSKKGILQSRIEEEFYWMERAYYSIKEHGYQPLKLKNHVEVLRLVKDDNRKSYLLLDGNHRVSAMHALGIKKVNVILRKSIYERECSNWYCVRKNMVLARDALNIFNAYFCGNKNYRTTRNPAQIIA